MIEEILIDTSIPYNNYGQMAQAIKNACAVFNNIQNTKISNKLLSYKPLNDNYLVMCFEQDINKIQEKEKHILTNKDKSDIMIISKFDNEELRALLHFVKNFLQQPYLIVHRDMKNIEFPEWILVFEKNKIKKYKKDDFIYNFDDKW